MNSREFLDKYLGMIIGIIIAVLAIAFGFVYVVECVAIIVFAAWLGKYIQENKESVKEKLKSLIDKF
ncbi:MAG: DUF2273 domain-containing protein [Clostridia bacterium]|nr:DUF2273 domain-containing protein [Clostridia bacterium]